MVFDYRHSIILFISSAFLFGCKMKVGCKKKSNKDVIKIIKIIMFDLELFDK